MKYKVDGLNELSNQFADFQVRMGFGESTIPLRLMLVHSEISEAFEAFRKDKYADMEKYNSMNNKGWMATHFERSIKDSFEDEIADTVIRLLAVCGENNIDIENHIQLKMKYNEQRGFKFGGKKF